MCFTFDLGQVIEFTGCAAVISCFLLKDFVLLMMPSIENQPTISHGLPMQGVICLNK